MFCLEKVKERLLKDSFYEIDPMPGFTIFTRMIFEK